MEERKVKEKEAAEEHESETIMDKDKLTESLLIMLTKFSYIIQKASRDSEEIRSKNKLDFSSKLKTNKRRLPKVECIKNELFWTWIRKVNFI